MLKNTDDVSSISEKKILIPDKTHCPSNSIFVGGGGEKTYR